MTMAQADSRRRRRRQDTIDEIRQAALAAMAEDGVAGMSLSDVARRIGVRPPSLYVYFPNKLALYDDLFALGFSRLNEALEGAIQSEPPGPDGLDSLDGLRHGMRTYVGWCVDNPMLAQLMFWRPVPGFTPSEQSYRLSVINLELVAVAVGRVVAAGQLTEAARSEEGLALLAVIGAGVTSQQLANDPGTGLTDGRFTRYIDETLQMWIARYTRPPKEESR